MGGKFSHAKKVKKNEEEEYDKAMLEAKVARDRLIKYKKRMEEDNDKQVEIAKRLVKANKKDQARIILRQKKQREVYINQADGMLQNIQAQIDQMERTKLELEVFDRLKETNEILKKLNEKMPIEEIEELMESNADLTEQVNEISNLLAQDMSPADQQMADEEYEALLDKMMEEDGMTEPTATPAVPEPQPPHEVEEEEEEQEAEKPQKVAVLA